MWFFLDVRKRRRLVVLIEVISNQTLYTSFLADDLGSWKKHSI